MTGLFKVTAKKGRKIISSKVFGNDKKRDVLLSRLMNRKKIVHADRGSWELLDVKIQKEITMDKEFFGVVITPLDTHLMSAIIGLYFGGSLVKK